MAGFAEMPSPPYFAVIFSSQRRDPDPAYDEMAAALDALAREQPGFLGRESARGADGFGVSVSYFSSEAAIAAWRAQGDHFAAQRLGKERWYDEYRVRVAKVERAYGGPR